VGPHVERSILQNTVATLQALRVAVHRRACPASVHACAPPRVLPRMQRKGVMLVLHLLVLQTLPCRPWLVWQTLCGFRHVAFTLGLRSMALLARQV